MQGGKHAGRQASRQPSRQASRQADKLAGKQAIKQAVKQAGKQAGKQAKRQASTRKAFCRSHALEGLVIVSRLYYILSEMPEEEEKNRTSVRFSIFK